MSSLFNQWFSYVELEDLLRNFMLEPHNGSQKSGIPLAKSSLIGQIQISRTFSSFNMQFSGYHETNLNI